MMRAFGLREVAAACACTPPVKDAVFTGICIDSRKVKPGDLFVAISGERYDAHQFLAEVEKAGAVAALIERVQAGVNFPQLHVEDTVQALGAVAQLNRDVFAKKVIALTGSAGKTTTKEMIAAILQRVGNPLVTEGNLNNHIGVPLTLLRLAAEHDSAVIEMGASALGEIRYLAGLAKPDVALITNVAAAHIEGFGSIENVAQGKAEIFEQLPESGTAIINLDNAYTASLQLSLLKSCKVLMYSMQKRADVFASSIQQSQTGMQFILHADGDSQAVQLQFIGAHNVGNAVAAAACCLAVGVPFSDVVAGLEKAQPYKGRLQSKLGVNGCLVIDDTYNANPASVQMAIHALMASAGEKYLVLGDMGELGADAEALHCETGLYAKKNGVTHLLATGRLSQATVQGFGEGAQWFPDWQALARYCITKAQQHAAFLVKGSRSAGMERVVNVLLSGHIDDVEKIAAEEKMSVDKEVLEKTAC